MQILLGRNGTVTSKSTSSHIFSLYILYISCIYAHASIYLTDQKLILKLGRFIRSTNVRIFVEFANHILFWSVRIRGLSGFVSTDLLLFVFYLYITIIVVCCEALHLLFVINYSTYLNFLLSFLTLHHNSN